MASEVGNPVQIKPSKQRFSFKVLVIGDKYVGKTSIIHRYVLDEYKKFTRMTVGSEVQFKYLDSDNCRITLQLWDLAGEEMSSVFTSAFYRGADGVVIVYDAADPKTFEKALYWKKFVDEHVCDPDYKTPPCIILANKSDLCEIEVEDSKEHWENEIKKSGFLNWYATSAKNNYNIDNAFNNLISTMKMTCYYQSTVLPRVHLQAERKDKKWANCTC